MNQMQMSGLKDSPYQPMPNAKMGETVEPELVNPPGLTYDNRSESFIKNDLSMNVEGQIPNL